MLQSDRRALKLLELQLRAHRPRLYVQIRGPLVQKGTLAAKAAFASIREEVAQAVRQFSWLPVPRGRVAVTMHFFSDHAGIPALHNLVKSYLDSLYPLSSRDDQPLAFRDDKHVTYLVAECAKPRKSFSGNSRKAENVVYITF